ncbi:MAG TPA: XRE family transcriptional regulator [Candidatus Yonathbacteria bacterium]|nr:XRE family transcriptional regulator [Candidatus Yonathbacteria bacterium]
MNKKIKKATDFQIYLNKQLKDKDFRELYCEYGKQLEVAYQIAKLRKHAKITQSELAKRIGTTQSNIARMERGQQNFTIDTLNKIAHTFNKKLEVSIG